MDPSLAECYWNLKEELDKLIQKKLQDPSADINKEGKYLMLGVQDLVTADLCLAMKPRGSGSASCNTDNKNKIVKDGMNPKSLLRTSLTRSGHSSTKYKTEHLKTNDFRAVVEFKGMQFVGKPKKSKQQAEKDAATEALGWLTQTSGNSPQDEDDDNPIDITDNMLKLLH